MGQPQDLNSASLRDSHWALSATVTERFLNHLAAEGIGSGLAASTFRQQFELPMLGTLDIGVDMVIVGVEFSMAESNRNQLAAVIRATGDITMHGASTMQAFPGLVHVRGDVLIRPHAELAADGGFVAVLDLSTADLVGMSLVGIDGLDADAQAQEMMGQMLFATLGGELFAGLAAGMGSVGIKLEPARGRMLAEVGVATGVADVIVQDESMTIGLRAVEGLEGHAAVDVVAGQRVGVGVASGALSALANRLITESLGTSLPFDLDVTAGENRVGARLRNQRLVDSPFLPDLRPGLRYTVKPRLLGDQLELSLSEAWMELPLVPSGINKLNRWIGGIASVAPFKVSVSAHTRIPAGPDGATMIDANVVDLAIGTDGVTFIVEVEL